jgi:hypothetical protein
MGCSAGFHANQARRLLCKERQQPSSRQPPLDDGRSLLINSVDLKD